MMLLFGLLLLQVLSIAQIGNTEISNSGTMYNSIDDDSSRFIGEKSLGQIPDESLYSTSSTSLDLHNIENFLLNSTDKYEKSKKHNAAQLVPKTDINEAWWNQDKHSREKKDKTKDFYNESPTDYDLNKEVINIMNTNKMYDAINEISGYEYDRILEPIYRLCDRLKSIDFITCMNMLLRKMQSMFMAYSRHRCTQRDMCPEENMSKPDDWEIKNKIAYQMLMDASKQVDDEDAKHVKFLGWIGKRFSNANGNNIPKRIPFHAWGGKRSNQVGTEKIQASRVPFNAWGGKRTYNMNSDESTPDNMYEINTPSSVLPYLVYKRSRTKFHSWGGKRNY